MKFLRPTTRVDHSDTLGRGMDAAITLLLFFGIGFALDRWLGTTPWCMIGMTLLAAVGLFLKFKYAYTAEMERLEAERRTASAPRPRDDRSAA